MEEFTHCAVCDRTPLVGEAMTVLSRRRRESAVCEQCLTNPRAAALGEAIREERVRTAAGAASVRRITPTPVPVSVRAPAAKQRAGRSASLAG